MIPKKLYIYPLYNKKIVHNKSGYEYINTFEPLQVTPLIKILIKG